MAKKGYKRTAGHGHQAGRNKAGYQSRAEMGGKGKKARMPNSSKSSSYSDTDSGAKGSNHGATGGLRQEGGLRPDTLAKPSTTNRYPKGLA